MGEPAFRWRGFEGAINYFARRDADFTWWQRFIDEMVAHKGNFLKVCCESASGPDPNGFGLGWPSRVPHAHVDHKYLNANQETEYLSQVISYCEQAGVHFGLGISTLDDWAFAAAYPHLRQEGEHPETYFRHLCPNKPQARDYIRAKVADLVTFYPAAKFVILGQHIKYRDCRCPSCRIHFSETMDLDWDTADQEQKMSYKYKVLLELTRDLVRTIREKAPMKVGVTLEGVTIPLMEEEQKYFTQEASDLDFMFFQNFNRNRENMLGVTERITSICNEVYVACSVYNEKVLDYSDYFKGAGWWKSARPEDAKSYVDMAIEARQRLPQPERFCGLTFWNISLHDKGDPMRNAAMQAIRYLSGQ